MTRHANRNKIRVPTATNNLRAMSPAIAAEFCNERNGDLTPDRLRNGSTFLAWWRCGTCGHRWQERVRDRTVEHRGCSVCTLAQCRENSLAARFQSLAEQWDRDKNPPDLRPEEVAWSSNKPVWWKCTEGPDHSWQESPNRRTAKGRNSKGVGGCPFCEDFRVSVTNSLATRRPDLAAQLHPTLNGGLTAHDITWVSTRCVVWLSAEGDVWPAKVRDRSLQAGNVPFETGHRLAERHTIAAVAPHLIAEWASDLNGDRTPYNTAARSGQVYMWRLPDQPDLVWPATPADRVRGRGHPFKHGHMVCKANSLATLHPAIARTWHPDNDRKASEVTAQSSYRASWSCELHALPHTWVATVKNRVRGTGCPECNEVGVSRAQHRVMWELRYCFPDIPDGRPRIAVTRLPVPGRQRTRNYREIDIVIPGLRVLVEYDGLHFHRHPDKVADDRRKTAELQAQGFSVLRLRERGLPLLSDDDIEIGVDAGNKEPHVVAALVLRWLLNKGYVVPGADAYFDASRPLRAEEAERHLADKHGARAKQRGKKAKA